MMKELKTYYSEDVPTDEDLKEGIRIARTHNCLVSIVWAVYHSSYRVLIQSTDSLSNIKDRMPKVYGL